MMREKHGKAILFIFVLLLLNFSDTKKGRNKVRLLPGRLIPRFEFLQDCENVSSLYFHITNVGFPFVGSSDIAVNAEFKVTHWIHSITKTLTTIYNCDDKTAVTCQLFQTWRFGDESCSMLGMKNQIWTPFFQKIHPTLKCPISPGNYVLRNGTIDMDLLLALPFPLEKYFWRVRFQGYDPEMYLCVDTGAQILRTFT